MSGSIPGIASGGGDISPDLSATANNRGGTNSLGGFNFGNYSRSKGVSPWIVGGVICVALFFMFKGGKR